MKSLRPLIASFWRRPFAVERDILRRLASRYGVRPPSYDAPSFSAGEDVRAPAGILNRSGMIRLAYEFLNGNIMSGDYFEFGCWGGRTFRLAYEHHKIHFQGRMHFWLFDSFQGLPKLDPIDEHPKWKAGDLCTSLDDFIRIVEDAGIPACSYTATAGYYEQTLTAELSANIASKAKAGLVYIDCDLYESTRKVLEFMYPMLQPGTVICFDDFYCFNGSPERGEQLAIREFLGAHRDVRLVDYLNFGWHGKSFIVHLPGSDVAGGT
ncbi:MAG: TylF/MycF/NovP-related O-methyltransferase [Chloroflexota bacterium]